MAAHWRGRHVVTALDGDIDKARAEEYRLSKCGNSRIPVFARAFVTVARVIAGDTATNSSLPPELAMRIRAISTCVNAALETGLMTLIPGEDIGRLPLCRRIACQNARSEALTRRHRPVVLKTVYPYHQNWSSSSCCCARRRASMNDLLAWQCLHCRSLYRLRRLRRTVITAPDTWQR